MSDGLTGTRRCLMEDGDVNDRTECRKHMDQLVLTNSRWQVTDEDVTEPIFHWLRSSTVGKRHAMRLRVSRRDNATIDIVACEFQWSRTTTSTIFRVAQLLEAID